MGPTEALSCVHSSVTDKLRRTPGLDDAIRAEPGTYFLRLADPSASVTTAGDFGAGLYFKAYGFVLAMMDLQRVQYAAHNSRSSMESKVSTAHCNTERATSTGRHGAAPLPRGTAHALPDPPGTTAAAGPTAHCNSKRTQRATSTARRGATREARPTHRRTRRALPKLPARRATPPDGGAIAHDGPSGKARAAQPHALSTCAHSRVVGSGAASRRPSARTASRSLICKRKTIAAKEPS